MSKNKIKYTTQNTQTHKHTQTYCNFKNRRTIRNIDFQILNINKKDEVKNEK
jgi:hypothetical protein